MALKMRYLIFLIAFLILVVLVRFFYQQLKFVLKVRQSCNVFFFCLIVLWSNCFVRFLEEFENSKSLFEINWPLGIWINLSNNWWIGESRPPFGKTGGPIWFDFHERLAKWKQVAIGELLNRGEAEASKMNQF